MCASLDLDCGSTFNAQSGAGGQVDLAGHVPVVHLPVGVTLITTLYEIAITIMATCTIAFLIKNIVCTFLRSPDKT